MAQPLELTVVLATYNRAETLRETLRHLADQTLAPARYEVIVVDDGSPDNTGAVFEEVRASLPYEVTYLRHENRGPGYTQNRGIRLARAPVILLMADDIWMSRQALETHLNFHTNHPEAEAAALGCVLQSPRLDNTVFLRTWDPFKFSKMPAAGRVPYFKFWACNISVKRDFLIQKGLFREPMGRAGPAAHEDPELGYRLSKAGLKIYYEPAALGHHFHLMTLDQARQRAYQRGLNWGEFRALVPTPEISVAYHVPDIGDHLRAWFGPGRQHLSPEDRNPPILLLRYLMRALAFNQLTVSGFWLPLLKEAERRPALAKRMRPNFYRGLLNFEFGRGCRDGERKFGSPSALRTASG